jgi:hypothetical protein
LIWSSARYYPEVPALYAQRGWRLPTTIGRVYDPRKAQRIFGFRCKTDFSEILHALCTGGALPFAHDPAYVSPNEFPPSDRRAKAGT